MAVSCVMTMSRSTLVSASSTSVIDGCVSSSSSSRNFPSTVRFRNGNAARFGRATLSHRGVVGFVKLEGFEKRRRWGAVASVSADVTVVSEESDGAEKSKEKELSGKLLSMVKGSDRGARFGKEKHATVGEVVDQLEQYGIPEPLQSPLTFGGGRLAIAPVSIERRNVVFNAAAAEAAAPEVVAEPAVEAPANPISELKLQSDILKKKVKKEELKRKRLVRKRHLRKKGRWPPSKMKKNQNV